MKIILFLLSISIGIISYGQVHFEIPVKESTPSALKFNHEPTKLIIDYVPGGLNSVKAVFDVKTIYNDSIAIGDTIYITKKTTTLSTIVLPKSMAVATINLDGTFNQQVLTGLLSLFGLTLDPNRLSEIQIQ